MHKQFYADDADFNPIVMTFEQFKEEQTHEKNRTIKHRRATRRARNILRIAAWSCMLLSVLSAIYLKSEITAIINIAMAITCIVMIKKLK
jgi:hypothetical protein